MCEAASKRFQRTQGLPRGADWCTLIIEEPVSMKLLHQVKLPLELQRDFRLFDIFFSILQINCMLVLSCTSIQKPTPLIYCTVSFSPGWGETHCSYFAHHAFTLHTNQSSFVFSMSFGHEIKSGVCMHSCIDIHTHTHTHYIAAFSWQYEVPLCFGLKAFVVQAARCRLKFAEFRRQLESAQQCTFDV